MNLLTALYSLCFYGIIAIQVLLLPQPAVAEALNVPVPRVGLAGRLVRWLRLEQPFWLGLWAANWLLFWLLGLLLVLGTTDGPRRLIVLVLNLLALGLLIFDWRRQRLGKGLVVLNLSSLYSFLTAGLSALHAAMPNDSLDRGLTLALMAIVVGLGLHGYGHWVGRPQPRADDLMFAGAALMLGLGLLQVFILFFD